MPNLTVSAYTATCAVGPGLEAMWQALVNEHTGLVRDVYPGCTVDTHLGRVAGLETRPLPAEYGRWDSRNNRLAWLGLQQDGFLAAVRAAKERYGADRVGLVLGTSTASIANTERAYRERTDDSTLPEACGEPIVHSPYSLVDFVHHVLAIGGPRLGVSTACSSSARAFGTAERWLRLGLADAVVVGGTDSLCLSVLYGFHALELLSAAPCRPFDVGRTGMNLGEGAGFALIERDGSGPRFVGYGETSDAHHMSSPHPEGVGARKAMERALATAGLSAAEIDYVNLHGTATRLNDQVEALAIRSVFAQPVPCSSTKGWTGHTLGAAGIVEAVIALLCLERHFIPTTLNCQQVDDSFGGYVQVRQRRAPLATVMSNSFGFGGNNCSLIFSTH